MAKQCAPSEHGHTKSAGCLVHKRKNPGRSPASIYFNLTNRIQNVKSGRDKARRREKHPANPLKTGLMLAQNESVGQSAANAYFTSTVAPASVNFFLMASASSLLTPSLIALGAPSTRSLASFKPRLVTSRTALMTLILLAPVTVKTTVNSVFSSTTGAGAAAPPPCAATGAAAAAETPSLPSSNLTS